MKKKDSRLDEKQKQADKQETALLNAINLMETYRKLAATIQHNASAPDSIRRKEYAQFEDAFLTVIRRELNDYLNLPDDAIGMTVNLTAEQQMRLQREMDFSC